MYKLGLEKAEEPEIKLSTSAVLSKKQEITRKTSTSALLIMTKTLTVWVTTNCGKFLKKGEYQTTRPVSWEMCMQVKKQQLELDMEQQTSSKQERNTSRLLLSSCLFNLYAEYIMRNARLDEAQAGIKTAGKNILRYADNTTLMAESEGELKSFLMKMKEESEKAGLKLNFQKT